jgi:hypothetical protein
MADALDCKNPKIEDRKSNSTRATKELLCVISRLTIAFKIKNKRSPIKIKSFTNLKYCNSIGPSQKTGPSPKYKINVFFMLISGNLDLIQRELYINI